MDTATNGVPVTLRELPGALSVGVDTGGQGLLAGARLSGPNPHAEPQGPRCPRVRGLTPERRHVSLRAVPQSCGGKPMLEPRGTRGRWQLFHTCIYSGIKSLFRKRRGGLSV